MHLATWSIASLVELIAVAPTVRLDLRYATTDNFTRHAVYAHARCLVRPSVAARLARVQASLAKEGLGLKLFDCYRPLSVQRTLWRLVPDPRYVADPQHGSRHNRGAAVDVTLVNAAGTELPMPTAFDDFTEKAHRNAPAPEPERRNREHLEQAMAAEGFIGLPTEWWHFDAPDWRTYPISDDPL